MAVGDIFGSLKNSVRNAYNNFFYSGRQAPPQQRTRDARQDARNQTYAQQDEGYQQGAYQQQNPYQQQYQQQNAYQQQYQQPNAYQQQYQQQNAYQQQNPYQQQYQQPNAYQQQYQQPQPGQGRNRRTQTHTARQPENVVDFGAYQQNMGRQNPQSAQPTQNADAPAQEAAQTAASLLSARVINARGMGDCRSAITLLRNGDAVVIVMENIGDPSEMRRLVDTLSGACYSLTATITKVSRHGVYLLAPQTMAVFADQATNTMNSAPVRPQPRNYQPGFGAGQRTAYAPPQQPQQPQHQQPQHQQSYAGAQAFSQRAAAPEEPRQSFYQRPAPQMAQPPAFSAQPAGYGYAPDDAQAAGEQ